MCAPVSAGDVLALTRPECEAAVLIWGVSVDLSQQYRYQPNGDSWDAWKVETLIRHVEGLVAVDVPLTEFKELDVNYWFHAGHEPTVRNVVMHMVHASQEVDPAYPVILGPDNAVMDGMHRIARAMLLGATKIRAVRLDTLPPPALERVELGATEA